MKTITTLFLLPLTVILSCTSRPKILAQKVSFGIYETVRSARVPSELIDSLKKHDVTIDPDPQSPVTGYLRMKDSANARLDLSSDSVSIVRSAYPVSNENYYYLLVAVNTQPSITQKDIKKTLSRGNSIEIHFNLEGARKWANLTKKNTGLMLAFVINERIYDLPMIAGQIKSGMAKINRLPDEKTASELSDAINAGIPE